MNTEVRREEPIIVLRGDNGYDNDGRDRKVYARELKTADVGRIFSASRGGIVRDSIEESLTVVYRDENGVAGLLRTVYGSDSPDADESQELKLIWFELS